MLNRAMPYQYMLRLPNGWREAIKAEAKRSHRSMNSEIVAAIEAALRGKGIQVDLLPSSNEKDRQGGHPDGLMQSQHFTKGS